MGGDGFVPHDAVIARIWAMSPRDPDEIDSWPADRVYKMLWYTDTAHKAETARMEARNNAT